MKLAHTSRKEAFASFLYILLISTFVISCENTIDYLIPTVYQDSEFVIEKEEISLEIDDLSIQYYSKSTIWESGSEDFLIGYNNKFHSLDIFSLNSKNFFERIPLNKEGPNMVSRVRQLHVASLDSIFLFDSSGAYKLINGNGTIRGIYGINGKEDSDYDVSYGVPMSINESRFHYDKSNKCLIFHLKPFVLKGNRSVIRSSSNFQKPIIGTLNLSTGIVKTLPVYYSEYAKTVNDGFSSDLNPNITFSKNKLLLNYMFEANIYEYDFQNGLQSFGGASNLTKNLVEPYDLTNRPIEEYLITESRFNSVFFESQNKIYYRVQWNTQDLKNPNGNFNSLLTKPASMTVWNANHEVIAEQELNRNEVIPDSPMLHDGRILLWGDPTKYSNENEIKLYAYKYVQK